MNDIPQDRLATKTGSLAGMPSANLQVDPKLLTKALRKMQGLVKGNGLDESKVILCEGEPETAIKMYRFKARTSVKLVPHYGVKVEPGRNTTCEVIPSESEFKRALSQIAINARTDPHKRKEIVDFIFSRSDKGFGIKEQRTKFHALSRNFVQHERCAPCSNTGRLLCAKCQGKGLVLCSKCSGRRQVMCPRCRGSARIHTGNKTVACQYCRGDGKISCTLCAARGQIKCQVCAALGTTACKVCAGSGWVSHLAHVEVFGQVTFDFDRSALPPLLVQSIERNPSRCIEKHELEVAIAKPVLDVSHAPQHGTHLPITAHEPEDTVCIDYDALCPFGPISFSLDGEKNSGQLFGFQTRLLEFPFFLDKLTKDGQEALLSAATQKQKIGESLKVISHHRFLCDILTQILWLKNLARAQNVLRERYMTGVDPLNLEKLIAASDVVLRHITRIWRYIGLTVGIIAFGLLDAYYYLEHGRLTLKLYGLPEWGAAICDVLLLIAGCLLSILVGKWASKWSQKKALKGIVPDEVLRSLLPKAGKTIYWSIGGTILTSIGIWFLVATGSAIPPEWLRFITVKLSAIIPLGL